MDKLTSNYIDKLLSDTNNRIAIVSGEGEQGTAELFTGTRSRLAITRRIIKETCGGDRWAYAVIETPQQDDQASESVKWGGGDGELDQAFFPNVE